MDNGHEPATRQDIATLRSEMHEQSTALRTEMHEQSAMLRSEMQHMYDDLKEAIRDVQTEMLKAFYNYAQTNELRQRDVEAASHSTKDRLAVLESRVTEIERRLNMPPQKN